jgi:hypothetical protein
MEKEGVSGVLQTVIYLIITSNNFLPDALLYRRATNMRLHLYNRLAMRKECHVQVE